MWIQECNALYPEVLGHKAKKTVRLKELEAAILKLNDRRQIVPEALSLIEEGDYWPYPDWWPKLSGQLKSAIPLPAQLGSLGDKERTIEALLLPLKHIEVVSILLRFTCPKEFGIMSPPVLGLLGIIPGLGSTYQYLRYLSDLVRLRELYQGRSDLNRIADYDMALWAAAHLEGPDDAARLRDEIEQDKDFQQIRLGNLMEGLASKWRTSIGGRLLLAEALLTHDHVAAAVMVGRCYEQIIRKASDLVGRKIVFGHQENPIGKQLAVIENELRQTVVIPCQLASWWPLRNDAVHGVRDPRTGDLRDISRKDTEKFLAGVQQLARVFRLDRSHAK